MEIRVKTFEELTKDELYALLQLRAEVFVVEQDCPYQDVDNKDQKALHVLGFENDALIAYTRIFKPKDYFKNASIGRVVVRKGHRGRDTGKWLMKSSIDVVEEYLSEGTVEISAQKYLLKFYNDLGFRATGSEYLEDNIPHLRMIRNKKALHR